MTAPDPKVETVSADIDERPPVESELVLNGAAGDALALSELAEKLNVDQTYVRRGLKRLEALGYVASASDDAAGSYAVGTALQSVIDLDLLLH